MGPAAPSDPRGLVGRERTPREESGRLPRRKTLLWRKSPVSQVLSGLDVLVTQQTALIQRQKIGIVANDGAVDRHYRHLIDLLRDRTEVTIARLFAAEHGIWGAEAAGVPVADGIDPVTGLPIHSIYGPRLAPADDALADLDCLVIDLPDVGARFYTRSTTLANCLRAAARSKIRVIVLDRPNPIGGVAVEGPLLRPGFESFVGLPGLPIRHGLTMGELARFIADVEQLALELVVVPAEGWQRADWHDQTGLPWIMPSPNLPTLETAAVYPGTCLIEGTNLSEGRGTTRPFELLGAPFIDAHQFAAALNRLGLPGVYFRPAYFRPVAHKHAGEVCGGVQVHLLDRSSFRPVLTGVAIVLTAQRLWPEQFAWRQPADGGQPFIDRLAGGTWLREAVASQRSPVDVAATWQHDERAFLERRTAALLYR